MNERPITYSAAMQFQVLACDYDETIAESGKVSEETAAALQRVKATGRKLLLVTGREIEDLRTTFDKFNLFDMIVAENGAVLYEPHTNNIEALAAPPPTKFVERLKDLGVGPLSVGHVIVATWEPHENAVLQVIRELSLELQVIFNKGAVMVLPAGVNKGSGLYAALKKLSLSPHNVLAVGDAENDHSFLEAAECRVAVSNALPALQEMADTVLERPAGLGVQDLAARLVAGEKQFLEGPSKRRNFEIGTQGDGSKYFMSPFEGNILIAGSSGAGKSTLATVILEQLAAQTYQFCIIDPEGDYNEFEYSKPLGSAKGSASVNEVSALLNTPSENAAVNMTGVRFDDRPAYFLSLLSAIQDIRSQTGRPQWLLVDEAHHVLPQAFDQAEAVLSKHLKRTIFITLNPSEVYYKAIEPVETVIGVGQDGPAVIHEWARIIERDLPEIPEGTPERGTVLIWKPEDERGPFWIRVNQSRSERRRHRRKYAEGELPKDRSFYFTGPERKLKLRAQNLIIFLQMAEGVDDETWLYHLNRGEYADWFASRIKDENLSSLAKEAQERFSNDPTSSRDAIRKAIEEYYTLPAKPLSGPKE